VISACLVRCPLLIVEHWLFTRSGVSRAWLVRVSCGGSRNGGPGFRGRVGTLLGSEGTGAVWCLGPRAGWFPVGCGCAWRVLVSVRFLRTAQWTRASPVFCRM